MVVQGCIGNATNLEEFPVAVDLLTSALHWTQIGRWSMPTRKFGQDQVLEMHGVRIEEDVGRGATTHSTASPDRRCRDLQTFFPNQSDEAP